jgi:hypothetical protein
MTRNLIAATSAALLAGAVPGFAQQSDGNAAAARENSAYNSRASVDGNDARLAVTAPRIFLQSWHRT